MLGELTNDEALLVLGTFAVSSAPAMRLHLSHAFAPVSHAPAPQQGHAAVRRLWAGRHGGRAADAGPPGGTQWYKVRTG
jgi:hypothetical protein